jgi:Tfp pilus assembly protein PilW
MKNLHSKHQWSNVQRKSNGFTLIELLLYVSVSALLLLGISAFSFTLLGSRIKNQTIAEVEQQGLQVMQMITQTARNAEVIISPAISNSSSSLTLDVIASSSDPTVFNLSSGVIRIKEGASAVVPLTNSRVTASALNFQNLSRASTPGTIRISFMLIHINPSGRNEYSFAKIFYGSASLRQP